ncbi:MAG: chorismate mutase [Methanomicrobiales archaeon]|nr:chorismate mutase [Methanomicrobiales archaeon]
MSLEELREGMAAVDRDIIALIARRQEYAKEIGRIKHRSGLPVRDEAQREEVLRRALDAAVEAGIDPTAVETIIAVLLDMSEERQREFAGEGNLP